MHKYLAIALLMLLSARLRAQKNDYNWITGYQSNYHSIQDSVVHGFTTGNIKLDFNNSPVNISFDSISMNFDFTSTSFSDSDGSLLFYSNGIYIANSLNKLIEDGDSLNTGYVDLVWDPTIFTDGYRTPQGMISLQSVSDPSQYYLISSFVDTLPNSNESTLYYSKILTTLIDMSANGGLGKVLSKNDALIQDTLGEVIQCVRHGNGRDWWVLIQRQNSNCFYEILLDTAGFHVMPDLNCLGNTMPMGQIGATCFSPDGTKYVYIGDMSGLNIYDFDRCTGLLSNPRNLPLPVITDSGWSAIGVAISPNSRYLYVSVTLQLYQFDLWANEIFSTIDTVGIYNGGHLPNTPRLKVSFILNSLLRMVKFT